MASKAGREFGARLFSEIEEARGVESVAPTPPLNQHRNEWIRGAAKGVRATEAEEIEADPEPVENWAMNHFIRSVARPTGNED
jgi:hypothetical protein